MMSIRKTTAFAALALGLFIAAHAEGGFLTTDPNAYNDGSTTWHGTQQFSFSFLSSSFLANVDYAVYAPGHFTLSFPTPAGSDPSNGTQYVYAYQLINSGTPSQSTIEALSVGIDGSPPVANIESLPDQYGNFGPDPYLPNTRFELSPPNSSARWAYSPSNSVPDLTSGQASEILLFTSSVPPHFSSGTVGGGGFTSSVPASLPSPIPEPSSVVLLGFAMSAILSRRVRH